MGIVTEEFFELNENLSKNESKGLPGVSERTLKYYKEIGILKGTKIKKRKGEYIFSPKNVSFLSFIRDLRCVGLPLSEVKKIDGIRRISKTNDRIKLLRLYSLLEEFVEKTEFKKKELEQLRKDILDFKNYLQNSKELSERDPEI